MCPRRGPRGGGGGRRGPPRRRGVPRGGGPDAPRRSRVPSSSSLALRCGPLDVRIYISRGREVLFRRKPRPSPASLVLADTLTKKSGPIATPFQAHFHRKRQKNIVPNDLIDPRRAFSCGVPRAVEYETSHGLSHFSQNESLVLNYAIFARCRMQC